MIISKKQPGE